MNIPTVITSALDNYSAGGDYEAPSLVSRNEADPESVICMTLMSDDLGRAQVLFPASCMLIVDDLNATTGRSLEVVNLEERQALLDQLALESLPAIPDITGFPAIVDGQVFRDDSTYVYVDAGDPDHYIQIKRDLLLAGLKKTQRGDFTKPVKDIPGHSSPEKDQAELTRAIEKFTSLRIKQRIEDTLELPPLPHSAQDIIRLRADPDAGADELSTIVEKDPSLSAQVVSWASSSFYGAPGSVKSVHDAIVRVLGFELVMNLSMGLALGRTLQVPRNEPEGYPQYWQKALWMALGTTAIITKIDPAYRPSFGLAYLSGLLHNFGHLVMAHIFPPHFELICRYREANPHLDASIIESHCLGITSEQTGSLLMDVWSLPEQVVSGLRHQKDADDSENHCAYSRILKLAQYVLAKRGIFPQTMNQAPNETLHYFQITEQDALDALDKVIDAADEVNTMAGMFNAK